MGLLGLTEIFLIVLISGFICLIPAIFFILTMQRALQRCAPENRTMTPGSTWLLLIPLFNLVWDFILVSQMAASLEREFKQRNIPVEPLPGKNVGLAWCILTICCIVPVLGIFSGLAALVCWILYWVKIAGFSATLAAPPVPVAARIPA
jgi:hypothetical protein